MQPGVPRRRDIIWRKSRLAISLVVVVVDQVRNQLHGLGQFHLGLLVPFHHLVVLDLVECWN